MSSNEEHVADTLPRIKSVSATRAPWTLHVIWADRTKDRIDLTGLVHRSRHFRIFLDQPSAFRKMHVADFGGGIEWENGLDYAADTLKVMADEQRPVSGADLAMFESQLDLSTAETAALLGLAERTVRAYRGAKRLPQAVAIAIRAIGASNTVHIVRSATAVAAVRRKRPHPMPPDGCLPETGGSGSGAAAMPAVSHIAREPTGRGRRALSKTALWVF